MILSNYNDIGIDNTLDWKRIKHRKELKSYV